MKADCSNLYLKSMTYTFHIDDMGYQVAIIYTLELPVYHDAVSGLRVVHSTQYLNQEKALREVPRFYTYELY